MAFTRLKNSSLGAKLESTPYTYEEPAAADGVRLREDLTLNLDRDFLEDDTLDGTLSEGMSVPGMWSDDLGGEIPIYARGGGSGGGSVPESNVFLTSLMGEQADNTDNTVDNTLSDATTVVFKVTSAPPDLEARQLILVDVAGTGATLALTQVISVATPAVTVWPPLPSIPVDTAAIYAGTNFLLSDSSWPPFSVRAQFDDTKFIKYAGCLCTKLEATFEPGQRVPMKFTFIASSPTYGHEAATDFSGSLDTTTAFLTCLGVELSAMFAGTTTGTPTPTSTILLTPSFGVAAGDKILIDTGTLGSAQTCTFTNATELVNDVAHGLANGARVKFSTTGILPAELSADIIYFVVNKNDDDFQVSLTSGGAEVAFTDDGTGTHSYHVWTKGTGNWETLTVSNVSGNPPSNTTVTHAAATNRADAGDTVYVKRLQCAGVGDSLTITGETTPEIIKCMAPTYGKAAIENTGRNVMIKKNPYWQNWQDFLVRDNAIGSSLTVYMGDTLDNIMVWYMPNTQNTEVGLTFDALMRNDVTAVAVKDTNIGNMNELVIASF